MACKTLNQRRQWAWVFLTRWLCRGTTNALQGFLVNNYALVSRPTRRHIQAAIASLLAAQQLAEQNFRTGKPTL